MQIPAGFDDMYLWSTQIAPCTRCGCVRYLEWATVCDIVARLISRGDVKEGLLHFGTAILSV
jgi:hypothetical protein